MESITKFFECLIPVTVCNIKCEYCYLIQQERRTMEKPKWNYDVATISQALNKNRLGGMAYISLCGAGETLVCDEVIELSYLLLKEGHVVNITTNGTLSKRFDELIKIPPELLSRLNLSFSLHYLELKKQNMVEIFFDNIDKIRNAGCSFVVQLNLYDGYLPVIEEIKDICLRRIGALPQVALTRKEIHEGKKIYYDFYTEGSIEEYIEVARSFDSPLFECTLKNFNVKRKEFCYAGLWSGVLDIQTGILSKCYGIEGENIFDDPYKKINFSPVGNNCPSAYCVNSSHFMALGVIPDVEIPSYAELRNRKEAYWYNKTMEKILGEKLGNVNRQYTTGQRLGINLKNVQDKIIRKLKNRMM